MYIYFLHLFKWISESDSDAQLILDHCVMESPQPVGTRNHCINHPERYRIVCINQRYKSGSYYEHRSIHPILHFHRIYLVDVACLWKWGVGWTNCPATPGLWKKVDVDIDGLIATGEVLFQRPWRKESPEVEMPVPPSKSSHFEAMKNRPISNEVLLRRLYPIQFLCVDLNRQLFDARQDPSVSKNFFQCIPFVRLHIDLQIIDHLLQSTNRNRNLITS